VPRSFEIALSRADAIAGRLTSYHGKPCSKHGTTARSLRSSQCLECKKEYSARYLREHPDRVRATKNRCRNNKPDAYNAKQDEWRQNNPEKRSAILARHHFKHREKRLAYNRERRRLRPELAAAVFAKRRARKLNALPRWLTAEDVTSIKEIYRKAKQTRLSVDHIIPLAGCRICKAHGLEVPWNMQLLTLSENREKGRRCNECWIIMRQRADASRGAACGYAKAARGS